MTASGDRHRGCETVGSADDDHLRFIGGASSVNAAVDQFYLRVLADPELKHYFAGVDMAS
jgi:truncated hemoglobin YjbI